MENCGVDRVVDKNDNFYRQTYIDVAKGILIICVIIGHVLNFEYFFTSIVKTVIYVFHMPAFFIISGILMNPKKIKNQTFISFVNRKIKRLIIPYVLFEIVGGILQMFLYGIDEVNPVEILYSILTMHCHIGADWFLPTLFFAEMIFFIIEKKIGQKMTFFMRGISFATAFVVPEWNYGVAVIRRILVAFGFIVLGFLFKKAFTKKNEIGLFISMILIFYVSYGNGVVDLSSRSFNNPILYLIGGIAGTYFVLDFSQYLFGKVERMLAQIGQESLIVMGTHQHIMLVANMLYGSVYSIQVQMILLLFVAIYEYIVLTAHCIFYTLIS